MRSKRKAITINELTVNVERITKKGEPRIENKFVVAEDRGWWWGASTFVVPVIGATKREKRGNYILYFGLCY